VLVLFGSPTTVCRESHYLLS